MGLGKSSIQRLVLMPLDNEVEDLTRENNEFFFGFRVGFQDRFDVDLCAYTIQDNNFTRCVWNQSAIMPTKADRKECGVPEESVPNRSAALLISLSSSLCLSLKAFALGSKTASSSYNSSLSAGLAARAASISASLAFRVPFFFGGAALDTGAGFSCSDSEFSQSL